MHTHAHAYSIATAEVLQLWSNTDILSLHKERNIYSVDGACLHCKCFFTM